MKRKEKDGGEGGKRKCVFGKPVGTLSFRRRSFCRLPWERGREWKRERSKERNGKAEDFSWGIFGLSFCMLSLCKLSFCTLSFL